MGHLDNSTSDQATQRKRNKMLRAIAYREYISDLDKQIKQLKRNIHIQNIALGTSLIIIIAFVTSFSIIISLQFSTFSLFPVLEAIIFLIIAIGASLGWAGLFMLMQKTKEKHERLVMYRFQYLSRLSIVKTNHSLARAYLSSIETDESNTPHTSEDLGTPVAICIICHFPIYEHQETIKCPYCKKYAHKSDFLEWIKIKGLCPNCHQRLSYRIIPCQEPFNVFLNSS